MPSAADLMPRTSLGATDVANAALEGARLGKKALRDEEEEALRSQERRIKSVELSAKEKMQPRVLALEEAELTDKEAAAKFNAELRPVKEAADRFIAEQGRDAAKIGAAKAKALSEDGMVRLAVEKELGAAKAASAKASLDSLEAEGKLKQMKPMFALHAAMTEAQKYGNSEKAVAAFNAGVPEDQQISGMRRVDYGDQPDMWALTQKDGTTVYMKFVPGKAIDTFTTASLGYKSESPEQMAGRAADLAAQGKDEESAALMEAARAKSEAVIKFRVEQAKMIAKQDPAAAVANLVAVHKSLDPEDLREEWKKASDVVRSLAEYPGSAPYQQAKAVQDKLGAEISKRRKAQKPVMEEIIKMRLKESEGLMANPDIQALFAVEKEPEKKKEPVIGARLAAENGMGGDLGKRSAEAAKVRRGSRIDGGEGGGMATQGEGGGSAGGPSATARPAAAASAGEASQAQIEAMVDDPQISFFFNAGFDAPSYTDAQNLKKWYGKVKQGQEQHRQTEMMVRKIGGQEERDFYAVQDFLSVGYSVESPADLRKADERGTKDSGALHAAAVAAFNRNLKLRAEKKKTALSDWQLRAMGKALGVRPGTRALNVEIVTDKPATARE